jgi:hypothetical protein
MICSLMGWTEQEYNFQSWDFVRDLILELKKQYKSKI